jgi:hypothetical protein
MLRADNIVVKLGKPFAEMHHGIVFSRQQGIYPNTSRLGNLFYRNTPSIVACKADSGSAYGSAYVGYKSSYFCLKASKAGAFLLRRTEQPNIAYPLK